MRHRAAVGVTENTDALAISVSEQTGEISYAKDGTLTQDVSIEELKEFLERELRP
jgi:diadenylate cyclase